MDEEDFNRIKELMEDLKQTIEDASVELCELKFWKGCKILKEAIVPLADRILFLARVEAKRPVKEIEGVEEEELEGFEEEEFGEELEEEPVEPTEEELG